MRKGIQLLIGTFIFLLALCISFAFAQQKPLIPNPKIVVVEMKSLKIIELPADKFSFYYPGGGGWGSSGLISQTIIVDNVTIHFSTISRIENISDRKPFKGTVVRTNNEMFSGNLKTGRDAETFSQIRFGLKESDYSATSLKELFQGEANSNYSITTSTPSSPDVYLHINLSAIKSISVKY